MSAMTFKSANVQTTASKIEGLKNEIQQILDGELTNEMIDLKNIWKSNAADSYSKQFETIKSKFVEFYDAITYMYDSINSVATLLNRTDESNDVKLNA